MGCDEDYGNLAALGIELRLQLKTRHSRHTNVRDQTCDLMPLAGLQKFFRGGKRLRRQFGRFQQTLESPSYRIVVIHNRYHFGGLLSVHALKGSNAIKMAQLYFGITALTDWIQSRLRVNLRKRGGPAIAYFLPDGRSNLAAILTSSASDSACILRITWPRCIFTVISLVPRSKAICLLSMPATTMAMTSHSRAVRIE